MNLCDRRLGDLFQNQVLQEITSEDIVNSCMQRIEALEPKVGAFLSVDGDRAVARAREADRRNFGLGEYPSAVGGVPYAIKDNICVKGWATTCASKILEGYVPVYDATVVTGLDEAGAIILGKTNMDEFAFGSSTENSAFGRTRNPWDLDSVPGGSSGGSAAAVAAGMVPFALGSDTGGSIRQPAALCGVVGMKPTYGLVSRYGLVAFASSLDQIGPITRSVTDCAALLRAVAGHDPRDTTSVDAEIPDYLEGLDAGVKGRRLAYPKELMGEGLAPEVKLAVQNAIHVLEEQGADVEEISLPSLAYAVPVYYLVAPAEASSNLARFDGVRYGFRAPDTDDILSMYEETRAQGFGQEAKRRIMLGTYALSAGYYDAYYGQAQKVRAMIARELAEAFETYDALLSPTSPTTAWPIGERSDDPLAMYLSDICTIPANLAGIPAVSVPCGLAKGLPIGLQVMGPQLGEAAVLQVAFAFEQAFKFRARPPLLDGMPEDPPSTRVRSDAAKFAEFAAGIEQGVVDFTRPLREGDVSSDDGGRGRGGETGETKEADDAGDAGDTGDGG